jgi:hypothetical protein
MKIINRTTKIEEVVKTLFVPNGLFFYDESKEPMCLKDDHLIGLGTNFYKLKELKAIIEKAESEIELIKLKFQKQL